MLALRALGALQGRDVNALKLFDTCKAQAGLSGARLLQRAVLATHVLYSTPAWRQRRPTSIDGDSVGCCHTIEVFKTGCDEVEMASPWCGVRQASLEPNHTNCCVM